MTLTLTLVRHGQTTLNARRHLQGSCDAPLTRTGRAGVRVTAQHLSGHDFDAVYSSPQGRAVQTAVEILKHHPELRLRIDDDLRELSFGSLERRPERILDAEMPWSLFVPDLLAGTHPGVGGGEPADRFMTRVRDVFARVVTAHGPVASGNDDDGTAVDGGGPDAHVLVVGHGLTLAAYLWTVDPEAVVALPNASVSTVEVSDGAARVVRAGVDVAGHGAGVMHTARRPVAAR
ncbi:histidine phosphatase family protein [Isoptericola chiayiensis]|uniref:Histidine phosphatase family protein n=1 Tax=Isoptericola chiayiensis TaxID=579446 RepID=A0ABP8Y813_9MICO|nr:histidine phosphatase family protein [Isoptericola chiayiensis]NOW02408.1 putative phosphoglycerate mutase [Isoptericola chiayiensis]